MTTWRDLVESERDRFVDRLVTLGFRPSADDPHHLTGPLEVPALGEAIELSITIPVSFPFAPPRVKPIGGEGTSSWHRERDNTLCLWAAEDEPSQPWARPEVVFERVAEWFASDSAGWPNDTPDLDLERYWPPLAEDVLFVHDGLLDSHSRCFDVHPIRTSRTSALYRVGRRWPTNMRPKRGHEMAVVIDVGELASPPREFDHLLDLVAQVHGPTSADQIDRRVRRSANWLLVRYERGGHPGLLALAITSRNPLRLACVQAAEDSDRVRNLRRGTLTYPINASIAIVGVGAIGSFVADQLARAGVARLTLIDDDVLRPGNVPRHLAGAKFVGHSKVSAVERHLRECGLLDMTVVAIREARLNPLDAEQLLEEHDLVVDATANATISRALATAAQFADQPLLSICVQHHGSVARLDRYPLQHDERHSAPVPAPEGVRADPGYESGCGNPVSSTPPASCVAAASVAASAAIRLVTGNSVAATSVLSIDV